jgi:hypothetical protein
MTPLNPEATISHVFDEDLVLNHLPTEQSFDHPFVYSRSHTVAISTCNNDPEISRSKTRLTKGRLPCVFSTEVPMGATVEGGNCFNSSIHP